jgi:hypothetical protein
VYPPVRQFESSELYRVWVENDHRRALRGERGLPFSQRAWLALSALLVASIIASVYAVAASAAPQPQAAACTAGVTSIEGLPARVFCGPARANATVGTATFRFTRGACEAGARFTVNIGVLSFGSSPKLSYFGVSLPAARPGTYTGKQVTLSFSSGGKRASLSPSVGARLVLKPGLRGGSFSGRDLSGRPVKGSFTC